MQQHNALIVVVLLSLLMAATSSTTLVRPTTTNLNAESFVRSLVDEMTLDEKMGQMTQGERASVTPAEVISLFLGSVLSGGGSAPGDNSPEAWLDMYDEYQKAALSTRLAIPIIYGQDGVHGVNNVKGATVFPHNIGLGATRDSDLLYRMGQVVAAELGAVGTTWTFAPCVAVPRDDRWGRTYEGFGETPELSVLGAEYVKGLQNAGYNAIGCAKHYMGDGGTIWGTGDSGYPIDQGDTQCDEATLRATHMQGYVAAIGAGVGTVMVSYSSWNGEKMHGNKYLVTNVLKEELGFDGFIVTDWNAVQQLPGKFYDQVVASVNAGLDMFMMPTSYREFINTLRNAVNAGDVQMSRIDDAVTRILRVKTQFGLFDNPLSNRTLAQFFGSAEHRQVAREAVRKSAVLLQNKNSILPLSKTSKVFVAGKHADDIGLQCGGWTISWQGQAGNTTDGTTILSGIRAVVEAAGGVVTYDADGNKASGNDVAIVVVGEYPYAEGKGDASSLDLASDQAAIIKKVQSQGVPVVVVVVSGRPVVLPSSDVTTYNAIVAAWLPGTEGAGIADVLFGDAKFVGKLPVSWPKSTSQEPINYGDASYSPLYPYGYGL